MGLGQFGQVEEGLEGVLDAAQLGSWVVFHKHCEAAAVGPCGDVNPVAFKSPAVLCRVFLGGQKFLSSPNQTTEHLLGGGRI